MKEILGGNLEELLKKHNIIATKTYESQTYLDEKTQVWELDEEQYKLLDNVPESEYEAFNCWWRYSNGSNLKDSIHDYLINGIKLKAFDNDYQREQDRIEYQDEDDEEPYEESREYNSLFDYINQEIGASTEKNVTAIVIHIAQLNEMKLSELMNKCQK